MQLMKIWVIERRKDHSVPMSSSLTAFSPFPSSISPFLLTSRWHQSTRDLHQRQLQLCGLERKVKLSLSRIKKHRTHYLIIFAPFTCRCNEARTLFGSDQDADEVEEGTVVADGRPVHQACFIQIRAQKAQTISLQYRSVSALMDCQLERIWQV